MDILALSLLIITSVLGFIAIFFTNFGTLIITAGAVLYAVLTRFSSLAAGHLAAILVLYVLGELFEYICIVFGAKRFGASNKAVIGALAGAVGGAIAGALFFGAGIIVGALAGIFLGAFIAELFIKREIIKAIKAGAGGIIGRMGAVAAKALIAIIMFFIIYRNVF